MSFKNFAVIIIDDVVRLNGRDTIFVKLMLLVAKVLVPRRLTVIFSKDWGTVIYTESIFMGSPVVTIASTARLPLAGTSREAVS